MILKLEHINKAYHTGKLDVPVLHDVSLHVEKGEYVAIMGPSGSGKSTLMNIIGCLDRPDSGTYELNGEDVLGKDDNALAKIRLMNLGFVFQNFQLLARETALENVALPLVYAKVPKKERRERAREALEKVGLGDRVAFTPGQLSGGQKQRVAIARAMVNRPGILLADEPTGALDSHSSLQIMELFQQLNEEGVTVIMITHSPDIAAYARRVCDIFDGVISERCQNEAALCRTAQTRLFDKGGAIMKVKGLIISITVGTALIVGTAYGIGMGMKKKAQPVEVVSVPSVNEASMGGMGATSTLYGTIISKDTQSVELDTSHTIRKVYVKQGDKVKKGDKLMTYDMDLDKLKREAQDLTRQGLELTLTSMQKDLATMQSGRLPANYGSGNEYQFFNGADTSDSDEDDDSADVENEDSTLTQAADTAVSDQGQAVDSSADSSQNGEAAGSAQAQNPAAENPEEVSGDDGTVVSGGSEDTGNQVIIDPGNEGSDDLPGDGQTVIQDDGDGTQEADPDTLTAVNTFLSDVNRLTGLANEGFDNLSSDAATAVFQEAFELFRSKLADSGETTVTDFFGASRTVTAYAVKSRVAAMTGSASPADFPGTDEPVRSLRLGSCQRGL